MNKIKLLYPPQGPVIYKRMIEKPEGIIEKGDIVEIINKNGDFFGYGFYNPKSSIILRLITREYTENFDLYEFFFKQIEKAVNFRKILNLPNEHTNAYRLIHDWGDGLSGVVVDVYSSMVVVEIYSYAYYLYRDVFEKALKQFFPENEIIFKASDYTEKMEGFKIDEYSKKKIKIKENGIIFEVNTEGYKTGFFCDQRENRMFLTNFVKDKTVLDLFSYTGGFGIYAKKSGAKEVTCVDLDETAIAQLKRNANLNKLKINAVRSDVFTYMRQMINAGKTYDVVILDPNKLITSREMKEKQMIKYIDLNKLALKLVKSGGIFVSCSCSGLLSMNEFVSVIKKASSISKKIVSVFKKSGAASDHPFMINYPEGEYLKVIWMHVIN